MEKIIQRIGLQPRWWAVGGLLFFAALANSGAEINWRAQSIYQIVTDRFYDGDPSNNNADGNFDPAGHTGRSTHGGDFKGIEEKLNYVKALGATAIWISPVVLNARGEFHGYAGLDFYKVDPQWGTLADLQHLVGAAHERGMLVIDDIVVNHGGDLIDSADPSYPQFKHPPEGYKLRYRHPNRQYPPPFDLNASHPTLETLFHNNGMTRNYKDSTEVELGELSGLDDFRTESPYIREQMEKIYAHWIEQAGFDGFRVDTVKHVDMGFWRQWCPAIHSFAANHGKPDFFMFGEVLQNSDAKCGSYTGEIGGGPFKLDSVLDYPLYFDIKSIFARAEGNTEKIERHYAAVDTDYAPSAQMRLVTFLDNHDQPRFLSPSQANGNTGRLKLALTFLYTSRGIPCLYYGTEQAFDGETDPYDREDMFAGEFEWGPSRGDNFNMAHPLFRFVAMLNNFRRLYPALQDGAQISLASEREGPGILAFVRILGRQEIVVALNTAAVNKTLPPSKTIYPPGTTLVNLLEPCEVVKTTAASQTPAIVIPPGSAKIFIAETQKLPLDPVVTSVLPAHDARGVNLHSRIEINFSQPMNAAAVEKAFSTTPRMAGSFSWSARRDKVTFSPAIEGFARSSTISVRIAGAKENGLHGAFESCFATGK